MALAAADFTCPFCGLACDDVRVRVDAEGMQISANGCAISERALHGLSGARQTMPRVRGQQAALAQAVAAAAAILRSAKQPLLAGLATDIAGARAAMRLAERTGAVTDHMNFGAKMRNVLTTQDRGWMTTTFAEVKNRADVLLIVGSDVATRFPRFFERLVVHDDAMFTDSTVRRVIYLGDPGKSAACRAALGKLPLQVVGCDNEQLGEVLGVLRMLVSEHPALTGMHLESVGGVSFPALQALAQQLRSAKYGVAAWAAADFDFAHADLTVQRIVELVKDLNNTTRFAGLPLGGSDGDLTMNQVHVWQSGFALRSDFGRGYADYDPHGNGATRLLERGAADAVLWISSFSEARLPPPTDVPLIVLGRADMTFEREPEVVIPVGTPGVDHAGHFVRSDKVVTMRLGKLRTSALPSVAEVVAQIEAAL